MNGKTQPPSIPPYQGGRPSKTQTAAEASSVIPTDPLQAPSLDKGRDGEGLAGAEDGEGFAFLPYNKTLTARARENRNNPTMPESRIWNLVLRHRQFVAYKFLRQKPIGNYIVDFYCSKLRLVIEIDGDSHAETTDYDAQRTTELQSLGLDVIRYANDDVMRNIEGVYEDLWSRIQAVVATGK